MKLGHLLLIILLVPSFSSARIWRVQQDGSGDFANIQQAVDAASPRDTVLVGPGRYDQFWLFDPIHHIEVIVGVHVDSLTIIGTDRDSVIIGPTTLYPLGMPDKDAQVTSSIGLVFGLENSWGVVENMTFENVWRGIDLYPSGIVSDCVFRGIWDEGVFADKAIKITIQRCSSYNCIGRGVVVYAHGSGQEIARVSNCYSEGSQAGIYVTHPNAIIEDCIVNGCNTGFSIVGGAVTMQRVESNGCFGGLEVTGGNILMLSDSVFRNSIYADLSAIDGGYIHGENLILAGGCSETTIHSANGLYDLHNSNIGRSDRYSVKVLYHIGPDDAINLTGNYWGTTSSDSIAAWIWDSQDTQSILTTVRYEPFSPVPVPNETRSMGDVKAMFRR